MLVHLKQVSRASYSSLNWQGSNQRVQERSLQEQPRRILIPANKRQDRRSINLVEMHVQYGQSQFKSHLNSSR